MTIRSDDVIVTSSGTTLSRIASGKGTAIVYLTTLENNQTVNDGVVHSKI